MRVEKGFYQHFCDMFLETFKLLTISEESIRRRARVTNPELIKKLQNEDAKIIWYTAHMGNWEWFTSFTSRMDYEVLTLYKPQSNKYFDELIKILRERFGSILTPMKSGYRALSKLENETNYPGVCIIGDQYPGSSKSTAKWIDFLNQETAFLTGAEEIALRRNYRILFPIVSKPSRGFYEVTYQEISSKDATVTYAKLLEDSIMNQPQIWLWSHKRWKDRRSG